MKETDIAFSWSSTFKFLGVGLFALALGVLMTRAEGIIVLLGYLFVAGGVLMLLFLPFTGGGTRAPCPLCGARVEMVGYTSRCIRCEKCDEYLEGRDRKLRQMDLTYVSKEPVFQVPLPWQDLSGATAPTIAFDAREYLIDTMTTMMAKKEGERLLPAVWPSGCCVCGAPAKNKRAIGQVFKMARQDKIVTVREVEVKIIVKDIPYCDAHNDGVSIATGYGGWCLKFRSYGYRNEFLRLNKWVNAASSA